ncbi:cell division protein FtsZ, partial [mine drainage metagenome]
ILSNATKGIVEMVTKPGLVNIDFADLRTVIKDSGYAVIGTGEGFNATDGTGRAMVALENALKSPLLDVDLSTAKKALVNIVGGANLTLREAEGIFQEVASRISEDALLKWGARIDEELQKDTVRIMLVVSGVDFPDYTEAGLKKDIKSFGSKSDLDLDDLFSNEKLE